MPTVHSLSTAALERILVDDDEEYVDGLLPALPRVKPPKSKTTRKRIREAGGSRQSRKEDRKLAKLKLWRSDPYLKPYLQLHEYPVDPQTWAEWANIIVCTIQDRLPLHQATIKPRMYTPRGKMPPRIFAEIAKYKSPIVQVLARYGRRAYTVSFPTIQSFTRMLQLNDNKGITSNSWSMRSRGAEGSQVRSQIWDTEDLWRGLSGAEIRLRWFLSTKPTTPSQVYDSGVFYVSFWHYLDADVELKRHAEPISASRTSRGNEAEPIGAETTQQRVVLSPAALQLAHEHVLQDERELDSLLDGILGCKAHAHMRI